MSEVWYDLRDGAVLIGAEAAAERLDEGGPDIVPLKDLLTSKEFPPIPYSVEKQQAQEWDRNRLIELGQWVLSITTTEEEPGEFTYDTVKRLYHLGLSPSYTSCLRNGLVQNMREFRVAIGATPGPQTPGSFDTWTLQNFVDYARSLEKKLGRRPRLIDYDEASLLSPTQAPTRGIIEQRVGGLSIINEHLGYPTEWDRERLIDYGMKFVDINGPDLLNVEGLKIVSARKRGPNYATIHQEFRTIQKYRQIVFEQLALRREKNELKLRNYHQMIENGDLPKHCADFTDEKLLQRGACFLLAKRIAPELFAHQQYSIACGDGSQDFIQELLKDRPSITAGTIELEAERLGVFDDIWPPEDQTEYLRVKPFTSQELTTRRKKRYNDKRKYRKQDGKQPQLSKDPETDLRLMRESMERLRAKDSTPDVAELPIQDTPKDELNFPTAPETPAITVTSELDNKLKEINAKINKTYTELTKFIASASPSELESGLSKLNKEIEVLEEERSELMRNQSALTQKRFDNAQKDNQLVRDWAQDVADKLR